jgi:hypothetical protein
MILSSNYQTWLSRLDNWRIDRKQFILKKLWLFLPSIYENQNCRFDANLFNKISLCNFYLPHRFNLSFSSWRKCSFHWNLRLARKLLPIQLLDKKVAKRGFASEKQKISKSPRDAAKVFFRSSDKNGFKCAIMLKLKVSHLSC